MVADTITYVDTIPYYYPVPKDSTIVRYVTVRVPKYVESVPASADSLPKYAESDTKLDECVPVDSVEVQLPITQKVYKDSSYTAYVSGFQPHLDSLIVYPQKYVVTISERRKPPRWHIGPSVGVGVTTEGIQPTLGVTLTYSIWSW